MKINKLSEIEKSLKKVRLKSGSSCILHASLINFGLIENVPIDSIPNTIFNLISKKLGKGGTLSALTPSYSYAKKKIFFDLKKSPVSTKELGTMSEFICKSKQSYRSLNPLFRS